jgi:predicted ATPase
MFQRNQPKKFSMQVTYSLIFPLTSQEIRNVYNTLGNRKISDLYYLPQLTDQRYFAILTMLSKVLPSAFFIDVDLTIILCAKIIVISMTSGNCPFSCLSYLVFGWLERRNYSTYELCYEWGQLGHRLCEAYSEKKPIVERSQVWEVFGNVIIFFTVLKYQDLSVGCEIR